LNFTSAASFRQSLETRLLERARREGRDVQRLRTQVAFERFLVRVFASHAEWVLKGGYALEARLRERARSTLDLDLNAETTGDLLDVLQDMMRVPVHDHFAFSVRAGSRALGGPPEGGRRFHVEARLAARPFSTFHVDIGIGDVLTQPPEWIDGQTDLSFAGLPRTRLRVYPLATHFAEKLHAYTRPRPQYTRVKDLVDLALLLTLGVQPTSQVRAAVEATFTAYDTHPLPTGFPPAPRAWAVPFRHLAEQVRLEAMELPVWEQRLSAFLAALLTVGPTSPSLKGQETTEVGDSA